LIVLFNLYEQHFSFKREENEKKNISFKTLKNNTAATPLKPYWIYVGNK